MNQNREQWLEERRKGIGGSDAAKLLGYSRWGGPFSVWNEKVNGVYSEVSDAEAVHFGNVLEDVVAREFEARSGLKVHRINSIITSKEHPFMLANIDRKISGQNVGLECKTANARKADEWKDDELPSAYYCQVQHYNAVMGWDGCWIACLIGGQRFVHKFVPRKEDFIRDMIAVEKAFWENYVMTKTAPALTLFDDATALPQTEDTMLDATEADLECAARLARVNAEIRELETHKALLENVLKTRIGENAGIKGVATFKATPGRVSWKDVAAEFGPEAEVIEKHRGKESRTFRFNFKEAV